MKIEARPWTPQDLIDDLQDIINEESKEYLNTRRTTLEMALAYLKEHFTEKWIPVSERLPEPETDVLTFCCGNIDILTYRYNKWGEVRFMFRDECGYWKETFGEVTHWMPLPEPPKEE